ncbi:MAG: hypothetical protein LBU73_00260 [Helicobacteraceae bacterium]|jgi:hypothetical protein|nr:hypothetical protein [Helicobacteraceae bacterium]
MRIDSFSIGMSSTSVSAKTYSAYEKSTIFIEKQGVVTPIVGVNSDGDTRLGLTEIESLSNARSNAVFSTGGGASAQLAQAAAQQVANYKAPQSNVGEAALGFTQNDLNRFVKSEKIGNSEQGYQAVDKVKLILMMLEKLTAALTGKKNYFSQPPKGFFDNVFKAAEPLQFSPISIPNFQNANNAALGNQPQPQMQAVQVVEITETYSEAQNMDFRANGVVNTADGRQINFDLNVSMSYEFFSTNSIQIQRAVDIGQLCDPLVINFNGNLPEFTQDRYSFDIIIGGEKENIFMPTGGSGFLAYDKNGNGLIDGGNELFGAASGNGFAELSAYDGDGNGWIDENDEIFEALKIMSVDKGTGEFVLVTLKDAGVGAIFLGSVAANFEINSADNETQGIVKRNGLFLFENGESGLVQHIDMTC